MDYGEGGGKPIGVENLWDLYNVPHPIPKLSFDTIRRARLYSKESDFEVPVLEVKIN